MLFFHQFRWFVYKKLAGSGNAEGDNVELDHCCSQSAGCTAAAIITVIVIIIASIVFLVIWSKNSAE